jgi:hypothetical protein
MHGRSICGPHKRRRSTQTLSAQGLIGFAATAYVRTSFPQARVPHAPQYPVRVSIPDGSNIDRDAFPWQKPRCAQVHGHEFRKEHHLVRGLGSHRARQLSKSYWLLLFPDRAGLSSSGFRLPGPLLHQFTVT